MTAQLRRRFTGSDDGASLILVLLFVAIVATVLAALLPYTASGIGEASTARDVRGIQNAVDGGMQGAIGQARINADSCVGSNLPTYSAPTYTDPVTGETTNVTVTCQPSGTGGSVGPGVPPYAITTTNGPLLLTGNKVLSVNGGIYTNGDITEDTGAGNGLLVDVTGAAYTTASHTCDAGLVTASAFPPTFAPHCPANTAGGDPGLPSTSASTYPSPMGTTIPTVKDPLGTCASDTSVVTFVPGYYSEIPQVDPVTCKNNTSAVWWFSPCASYNASSKNPCGADASPGVYFLDFPDGSYNHYKDSQATWDLDPSKLLVVGGSWCDLPTGQRACQKDWDASTSAASVSSQAGGTRCDPKRTGVQFVLGGPSQISTGNNSTLELCASRTAPASSAPGSRQRIALYGLPSDYPSSISGARSEDSPVVQKPPTSASNAGGSDTTFVNQSGATTINDGQIAAGAWIGSAQTFGVTLSGYTTPPDGSLVTHAWLEIRHSESDSRLAPTVTVTYGSGPAAVQESCTLATSSALTTVEVDLMSMKSSNCTASGPDTSLAQTTLRWRYMQGMTVTYEVSGPSRLGTRPSPATALLDGVELKVKTVSPALEPERPASNETASPTCTSTTDFCAYNNNGNFTSTDNDTYFIGTVYTPQAPVYAVVHNNPETVFQRGIIAKALTVDVSSSSKQTESPFQLPFSSTDRVVLFTACQVVTRGDTCSSPGARVRLRAQVHFVDYSPADASDPDSAQFFPGRAVDVQEWTTLR